MKKSVTSKTDIKAERKRASARNHTNAPLPRSHGSVKQPRDQNLGHWPMQEPAASNNEAIRSEARLQINLERLINNPPDETFGFYLKWSPDAHMWRGFVGVMSS